ncbi:Bug family tripartite tricarboxylate transporter substrate binding protein [Polynucleobacter kasalickyi]|uniref:Tripartite-type tricarboxylate transporter, receptor component TctC n=1 Tax=Polynucleobacter kasalickyi TaxID=1938817 RepID=A0A1W2A481_9BURK|nr:tripartite tricarboxylate transporter substrate binding protein [Polynucleobacter kasalickyi]SMC55383.1 Tripartite-type tricarboxylate transporter, receptor component TctC [Polynucleobacter kasalickyi]
MKRNPKKNLILNTLAMFLMVGLGASYAHAQSADYPSRAVKIIVPIAPGGGTDIIGRKVAQKLGEIFHQSAFVENKAGAGSLIGTDFVAKSTPDGYTLLVGGLFNMVMNKALMKNLSYDPAKDFIPVGYVSSYPFVLSVRPDLPVKDFPEFVKYVKERPGQLSYGSAGIGTLQHVWAHVLTNNLGLDLVHVPFKGAPPAYQEMMAGRLDMIFDNISACKAYVQAGKLKGLATSGENRSVFLPEIPTINESNLTKFNGESWFGIFAPAGTPAPVIAKLRDAMAQINKDPEFIAQVEKDGGRVLNIAQNEQDKFLLSQINLWVPSVNKSKLKLD